MLGDDTYIFIAPVLFSSVGHILALLCTSPEAISTTPSLREFIPFLGFRSHIVFITWWFYSSTGSFPLPYKSCHYFWHAIAQRSAGATNPLSPKSHGPLTSTPAWHQYRAMKGERRHCSMDLRHHCEP